ncbi:MAG: hypothetical protein IIA00_04820 [Proteobacteria bacterium]|nr:hypothetical protein [Pseudomonadota bacterium]
MDDEIRFTVEQRQPDGKWDRVGEIVLDEGDLEQFRLELHGIDLVAYARLSTEKQRCVLQELAAGEHPDLTTPSTMH